MAVQVRSFDQSAINSMPNSAINQSKWWDLSEEELPRSLSKNLNLKVDSPIQVRQEVNYLDLPLTDDQNSCSTKLMSQSHHEGTAMERTDSEEQCISSDSAQDESIRKHLEVVTKPVFVIGNPEFSTNSPQVDASRSMTHLPYTYADPFYNGLFGAYGPQAVIQPQMMGVGPARIPLPLDLAEDCPIYVNAKQYHGILRRRQMRARLEAQNKLVKTRKPYLHESRHLHALNRVRGSGGRFLSTKNVQQSHSTPTAFHPVTEGAHFHQNGSISELEVHRMEPPEPEASVNSSSGITRAANSDFILQQPDLRVLSLSSYATVGKRDTQGLMCNGLSKACSGCPMNK